MTEIIELIQSIGPIIGLLSGAIIVLLLTIIYVVRHEAKK